ncbi:ATP-binding protein [Bengtsoniella intestinalis]|uniref:ATP-binding protein n=1 Tax=Bengtsoniella intestinalis TaxID=3073143 RepID=UPI00391F8D5D
MKLMLILLLLITSLMAVVGAFLTTSVSSFYIDSFYQQMNEVFGENNRAFVSSLKTETALTGNTTKMREMIEVSAGLLGIDNRSRNYYILDENGNFLTGSDQEGGENLAMSTNLLIAMNALAQGSSAVGDTSDITAAFMDVAIPIDTGDDGYIIYILDDKSTITNLNEQLFVIIMQALLIGLLISVLLSVLLSKTMVGPIEKLTAGAERVASGDFEEELPVESNDEIGILTGTFNEMAQVLQTTLDAVESERNKLDTLFLHMSDGVVAFDHTGDLLHCNPAATALLQQPKDQTLRYEGLFDQLYPFEQMVALQRSDYAEGELTIGQRILELYLAPFADGQEGGVLIVLHDVTERHRHEERRREFVANVSHELRTPLTNVRSYAETLKDNPNDIPPDMMDSFLGIIVGETDRMTHIVQDLLTLSRLDSGQSEPKFEPFSFGDAIDSVYKANALEAKRRGHTLTCCNVSKLPTIDGDRNRLEQVMMNILSNAIKYTPDGGSIAVTAGTTKNHVWMEVSDNGIGIPVADQGHIFERFYRVDKARSRESGGTGLGLSIAREIVTRHQGNLRLAPHQGPGTTVRLTLPITQG